MEGFSLADFSTRKRHDILWQALGFVLQDLQGESSTNDVALQLRVRLDYPATEQALALTWLKKVAPLVPEASQTGAVVKAYGRYGRRWVWSPRRSGLESRLNAAGVIDTSEW